mgnify:CR=1 FL=1
MVRGDRVRFIIKSIVCGVVCVLIWGCGKTQTNDALSEDIKNQKVAKQNDPKEFEDFLGIGANPTPPDSQNNKTPATLVQNATNPLSPLTGDVRDFVSLMTHLGGILSIWESSNGSWVWTHLSLHYPYFGDAYNWQIQPLQNGSVRFVNKMSGTCLNAYGKGVIHYPCDEQNPNQAFRLISMKNGAFQIQNTYTKQCLETSFAKKAQYPVMLKKCIKDNNLEQQWIIIPPFLNPMPITYP